MAPRDRNTGRRRFPEPEWEEYADEYVDVSDDSGGTRDDDLPDWSGQDQAENRPSRFRGQSGSSRQPGSATPSVRRSTAPLPELSRNLSPQERRHSTTGRFEARPTPTPQPANYEVTVDEAWVNEEEWANEPSPYDEGYIDEYDDAPLPRRTRSRPRGRPRQPPRMPSMPPALAAALAAQERSVFYFLGASAISIFFMSILVAARVGDLPGAIPIHLDAAGAPDLWGTPSTVWRLVLAAAMITVMNAIAAWFLAPRDAFLGRFLVGSSLLAHVLAWIALFLLLW